MTAKKKLRKLPKGRKGAWFVKLRGSYIPCSWQGWLTYIPFIALVLVGFFPIVSTIITFRDMQILGTQFWISQVITMVMFVLPYQVALVVVMHWIARRKS